MLLLVGAPVTVSLNFNAVALLTLLSTFNLTIDVSYRCGGVAIAAAV